MKIVNATEEEFNEGTMGGCVACGALQYGCEPDAQGYECESCGECKVYGLEELLIMGQLNITDLKDEGEKK